MTGVENSHGPRAAHSRKFRPRFDNPDPLPAVSEFRLDHILAKAVQQESRQVCESLIKVSDNYQQDLKREIRKALAIEQKIQNKNIHAIKRAHKLTKQWQNTRKEFSRNLVSESQNKKYRNGNKRGNTGLGSDIDTLLTQSIDVSANVKSLAVRMAQLSRKRGGSGKPDQTKFPNLNRLLNSLDPPDPYDPNQLQNEPSGIKLDVTSKGSLPQAWTENGMEEGAPNKEHMESVQGAIDETRVASDKLSNGTPQPLQKADIHVGASQAYFLKDVSQNTSAAQIGNARKKDIIESDSVEGSSSAGHENGNSSPVNDDTVMDTDAFELFMDTNIAKYRERKDERSRSLSSFLLERNGGLRKTARNPLRLLSSGSLASGQLIKLSPYIEQDDPMKYLFLPRKSAATVLETPEMSLHKKLRIKVLHSAAKVPKDDACICQQVDLEVSSEQEEHPISGDPSATKKTDVSQIQAPNKNAAKTQDPNEDAWSSSEAPTEAELSSDNLLGSSSSDESSSDSSNGHINETNSYYVSLRSQMKRKLRKKQKKATESAYSKEPSPSRKHQPLHRVLQPKQSILKLSKAKTSNRVRAEIAGIINNEELQYTASPRASFVNENSVVGMILHVSEDTERSRKDDTLEDADVIKSDQNSSRISNDSPIPSAPPSSEGKEDMSQALGKLRSLIM